MAQSALVESCGGSANRDERISQLALMLTCWPSPDIFHLFLILVHLFTFSIHNFIFKFKYG